MEDFDQRRSDEEDEFNQAADVDEHGERPDSATSVTGERPSILGDRRTEPEIPQRPSILGDNEAPRTGPQQRRSITGRESMPKPPRQRAAEKPEPTAQPKPKPAPARQAPPQQAAPARKAAPKLKSTAKRAAPKRKAKKRRPPDPDWLKKLRKEMPPYADEILALLMIAVGLVSLLSLIGLASGDLADTWASFLSQTMGLGAAIVPLAIFVAGALLLIPKLGVKVRINWQRVIAGELFFFILLGYLHLVNPDQDPWAAAFAGKGGGWIGWSISSLLRDSFGSTTTGFILLVLLIGTGGWTIGIGRYQILEGLIRIRDSALNTVEGIERRQEKRRQERLKRAVPPPPPPQPATATVTDVSEVLPAYPGRPSIITGATGAGATNTMTSRRGPSITRTRLATNNKEMPSEAPAFEAAEEETLEQAEKEQEEVVKEPRHNFTANDLPDKKKVGRRSTVLPPLELLDATDFDRPDSAEINANAEIIEDTLDDFGLTVEVVGVRAGPTVTQYAVQPFTEVEVNGEKMVERVRVTRIASLDQDLALALSTARVRIEAPVPGERYIGIEVPNDRPGVVSLRPVVESAEFYKVYNRSPLALALGRDVAGTPVAADLAQMPHLLIAGTTGSGKSVCISAMTTCLIANNSPYTLRLIMIDPKMVELVRFNGLPHLLGRVEVEMERIIGVLRWTTREMDRRYKILEQAQARNLQIYNQRLGPRRRKQHLPNIVVFIDELADLMSFMPDETERVLVRLAQMARAVGIHLVVATQRPSTDVVTGLIKANFPARLSFAVASSTDSRVILDATGAQQLIGRGDMLFFPPEAAGPQRIQGCFVSDGEMERVVDYWVTRQEAGKTVEELVEAPWERSLTKAAILDETDDMLEAAIALVASSTSAFRAPRA
jgi:S-DNA-T family DNA segregation ATPase FtsK/SpoIIIE